MTTEQNHSIPTDTPPALKSSIEQFREAIASRGLKPPVTIEPDGIRHYFSSNGELNNRAGWYEYHGSEIAFGSFGNIRTGLRQDGWVADIGRPLTSEERRGIADKRQFNNGGQKFHRERMQADARRKATNILCASTPAQDTHPWLVEKRIKAHGVAWWDGAIASVEYSGKTQQAFLRLTAKNGQACHVFSLESGIKSEDEICQNWNNFLIVTMRDADAELQSLQFIAKNGEKRFLYGGKMQGSYHILGDLRDSETVLIAESFANAATIHGITGHPVVVAFEAENLPTVARAIRKRKPDDRIILCADDDFKAKGNPGLARAAQAAQAIGGTLLTPDFGADRPDDATDFNDMEALRGRDAVATLFARHSLVKETKTEATAAANGVGGENPALTEPTLDEPTPDRQTVSSGKKRKGNGRTWGGLLTPSGPAA